MPVFRASGKSSRRAARRWVGFSDRPEVARSWVIRMSTLPAVKLALMAIQQIGHLSKTFETDRSLLPYYRTHPEH